MAARGLLYPVFVLLALAVACPSRAMDFKRESTPDGSVIIAAGGTIEVGDHLKLVGFLEAIAGSPLIGYSISSPGGNLMEGEQIAEMIHAQQVAVAVPSGAMCASACFLLFAAAAHRIAAPDALIGVHSASDGQGAENGSTLALTTLFGRDLSGYGVPAQIIGELVTTGPGQITWLDVRELSAMGVTFPRPNPPGMPSQQPVTMAEAPVSHAGPTSPPSSPSGAASTTASLPATMSPGYVAGLNDRKAWEGWFAGLNGPAHDGAAFWAGQRSLSHPRPCTGDGSTMPPDWIQGCQQAASMLAPFDVRRRSDPDYRKGWNSI